MFGAAIQEIACWARETEISALLSPALDPKSSVTLLTGDSGIGKTTILTELQRRLSLLPDVLVGFYESNPSDTDPLLRALNDLLSRIYTIAGIGDQIRVVWERFNSEASLSGVKDFLLTMEKSAVEASGLGFFAKTGLSVLQPLAEKAASLDARVTPNLIPKLGIDEFRQIIAVLQDALPKKTFVLIIDNLSASAEAVSADVRGFASADTIQAFVSQSPKESTGIHLIFSWKTIGSTETNLDQFRRYLAQYGGREISLGPIVDGSAFTDWLATAFPWFGGTTPAIQ